MLARVKVGGEGHPEEGVEVDPWEEDEETGSGEGQAGGAKDAQGEETKYGRAHARTYGTGLG